MAKKYEHRKTFTWNGKRYDIKADTPEELYEKVAEIKAALRRGEVPLGENMTVQAWYKEWKSLYKSSADLTAKSLAAYDEKFAYMDEIKRMKLKDVRDVHLQRILNREEGKSYSHVSKLRNLMKALFSQARKSRLIIFDPSESLVLPKNENKTHRAITEAERQVILRVAEYHSSGLWVLTMLYAGLRPGEAAALQWKDIDLEKNEIHVYAALESGTRNRKSTKTEAGVRDIPIHAELRNRFEREYGEPFAPVFPNQRGAFHDSGGTFRLWRAFKREMHLSLGGRIYRNQIMDSKIADDLTPYCLRHTFCTDLEAAGVPINVAKTLMGHSDITVTANIYTHKNQSLLHHNIAKLDGTWNHNGKAKNVESNVETI